MKRNDIYKCKICGNVVEVSNVGGGILSCCNQPMVQVIANTVDAAKEKHVPVIIKTANGYLVKVGEVTHPMILEHYIQYIELIVDSKRYKKYFVAGDSPEFEFVVPKGKVVVCNEYCNLHGLWQATLV